MINDSKQKKLLFTGINNLSWLGLSFTLLVPVSFTGQRNMSRLEDGLRSELMLRQHLRTLSEALRQQLQEAERRQREELERRIHENALLSTHHESGDKNELNHQAK